MLHRDEILQKARSIQCIYTPVSAAPSQNTKYNIMIHIIYLKQFGIQNSCTMEQDTHICEELIREVKILHN